ncbi:MAG: phosphotransferase family protein, partial [Acidimicrobiaceae bacterium]|nr:phosphotransferase family protein [Acidimicrobiaceae bacterium]
MEDLQKWLQSNIPKEYGNQSIVHGDWRIDNLIFKNGSFKLAAVIDW